MSDCLESATMPLFSAVDVSEGLRGNTHQMFMVSQATSCDIRQVSSGVIIALHKCYFYLDDLSQRLAGVEVHKCRSNWQIAVQEHSSHGLMPSKVKVKCKMKGRGPGGLESVCQQVLPIYLLITSSSQPVLPTCTVLHRRQS